MPTIISVSKIYFENGLLLSDLTAALPDGSNQTSTVQSAFNDLAPWLFAASKEAADFFFLSTIVYGIDRFLPRRAYSIDGWSREIEVKIPVYQVNKWNAFKAEVERLLSFLTGDYWKLHFIKNSFTIPKTDIPDNYNREYDKVNLFSGGLDSLIGAINILTKTKKPNLFISHYDPLMAGPKKDQSDLGTELEKKYQDKFDHLSSIKIFLSKSTISRRETTSRSRSLLFIGLALLLADVKRINIIVPENGTVSVNFPLSPSRRSSCSTRTTHPTFLLLVEKIFSQLDIPIKIENPFRFMTKGEMVKTCADKTFLESILFFSNSCGKRGHRAHWDKQGTHCGICMPCIYRQASLLNIDDGTTYGNEINKLRFDRQKGQDVGALLDFLKRKPSKEEIKCEIIANGMQDQVNLYNYINLIIRTRLELSAWVAKNGNTFVRIKAGLIK